MEKKKTDIIDEALKVFYLETATDTSAEIELMRIKSTVPSSEMSAIKKAELLERLSKIAGVGTLGEILTSKLKELKLQPEQLSQETLLPLPVVHQLLQDKIYTNNVPIMFFRNLLKQLGLSFQQAEVAIRKTFNLLQEETTIHNTTHGLNPAFRKGQHIIGVSTGANISKGDHRELYENKEALDKYLSRLNELLIN